MHRTMKMVVTAFATVALVAGPAFAAVQNVNTNLHLSANKQKVTKGGKVTFTIELNSPKDKCTKHMPVQWFRNGKHKGNYTTNNIGKVQFTKTINKAGNYYAKFPGRKAGQHPNRLNCKPDASNHIKIKIKK